MHILEKNEPRAALYKPGTIIHRNCAFWSKYDHTIAGADLVDVEFRPTDKGSLMCRMGRDGNHIFEPSAGSYKHGERETLGVVIFVRGEKHDNWTHLIVTGVSKKMQENRIPNDAGRYDDKGCAIFAEFAKPYDLIPYLRFRLAIANKFSQWAKSDLAAKIKVAQEISLPEYREGERRLITDWHEYAKGSIAYAHVRLLPPTTS